MKVFIVFVSLLLVNISFLTYQSDMQNYIQAQIFLKALAEECAAGAALYYDEESYAGGHLVFNVEEGKKYIEHVLVNSKSSASVIQGEQLTYEAEFQDDLTGYGADNEMESPSVIVKITAETEDLFRLPFLEIHEVTRMAKYELPGV